MVTVPAALLMTVTGYAEIHPVTTNVAKVVTPIVKTATITAPAVTKKIPDSKDTAAKINVNTNIIPVPALNDVTKVFKQTPSSVAAAGTLNTKPIVASGSSADANIYDEDEREVKTDMTLADASSAIAPEVNTVERRSAITNVAKAFKSTPSSTPTAKSKVVVNTSVADNKVIGMENVDDEEADAKIDMKLASAAAAMPDVIPAAGIENDEQAPEMTSEKSHGKTRLWNLQDADILSVINEVSQDTGINFIVDPRVNGKITLISSKPLRQGQVYPVFLSVLSALGYSAVPSGNVVKIVPNMESGEQATKVGSSLSPGRGDEVVVRVIPLTNVSAAQLIPVIRPMLPQWSNVSSYTPGNILILLGRASNLERIIDVIQDVDRASNSGIQIIPLKHASAQQLSVVLNNLQTASRASGETPAVSIAVDERSNSILLGGPKQARLRMRVLVSQLDSKSGSSSGNTEVVYLRYLQAKSLAPLLSKIAENLLGKSSGGAPQDVSTTTNTVSSEKIGGKGSVKDTKEMTAFVSSFIQAEPNTNAIVITAPPSLMVAIKSVIAKLDIRPAQVLVQAIIAEIDENDLESLGIQWGSVASDGSVSVSGSGLTSFPPLGAGIIGLIPGVKFEAVLSILQNQHGVDILSTPSIMVLDNQKATIEVGQDVPFQTGSYATTGSASTVTPFTTIDQKAVTLKLDVTPQINLSNAVRLKLNLKNDTLQNPQNPGLTPIINTSKITNSVIVNSEDILVLGGLMSNANNINVNKVPILGDIPILGKWIFQQKTTSQEKKNLMVFLKPVILHDSETAMTLSHQKYIDVRSTQANYVDEMKNIGKQRQNTMLPPWENNKDLPTPFEIASR